ncbi:MAG TPA: glycine/sarcosine/betaine reductase selenoprotein B family protein [Anaerolineae bacterium]
MACYEHPNRKPEALVDILENLAEWTTTFEAGWLAYYRETGITDFKRYNRPKNTAVPGSRGIDLSQSRMTFITTSGAYLAGSQTPFDAANDFGDYSIRLVPTSTPFEALAYAHDHYDLRAVKTDPQVLLPLRHLEDLAEEGVIGELAPSVISFMGYQPDVRRVIDQLIPAVVDAVEAELPDAALLVPA